MMQGGHVGAWQMLVGDGDGTRGKNRNPRPALTIASDDIHFLRCYSSWV